MKHTSVLVSVIIPVYNKRNFLPRTLRSVLRQSFRNFEVILVDDGSTDGGIDVIRAVRDSRIRIIEQSNQGECAARNTGIALARGRLLAFLDADDSWEPDFLSTIVDLRRRYPAAGLYATNYYIKTFGQEARPAGIVGLPIWTKRFQSNDYFRLGTGGELPISASSVCIPRHVINEVGGFPLGEKMGGDQHVWWRICARYPFAFDTTCLATYHRDADNRVCVANLPSAELPFSLRLSKELSSLGLSWRQRWHARRYMGAHLLHLARENARAGNVDVALRLLGDKRTWLLPVKWAFRRMQLATSVRLMTASATD